MSNNIAHAKHKRVHYNKITPSPVKRIILIILTIITAFIAAGLIGCAILSNIWLQNLPDYKSLDHYAQTGTTTIYANDGETVLGRINLINRIKVESNAIDQKAKDAIVAVEDERFYEHGAIDIQSIARAVFANLTGKTQGGSTLTQQLVRNTILLDEMADRTLARKVREMYLAMKIEQENSKDDILTTYMNVVNFGDGNYSIEAASQNYFGHSANELSLGEASLLAGIPNSPNQYNPRENYEGAIARQQVVLQRMLANNFITQQDYDDAIANPPLIIEKKSNDQVEQIAPYFVDYIKQLLKNDPTYNIGQEGMNGYNIYTTLDVKDQQAANESVESVLKNKDLDGSLCAIDPKTGYVLAMVGGRDYETNKFNLATQMSRQAGSTFKPFTLIAAMQLGMSPKTRVGGESPAEITKEWSVKNSGNSNYGTIDLYSATASSVNTVYAKVAHEIGAQAIIDTAHALGIKSDLTNHEAITLGTEGVNTLEMASAYATIAAGGIYREPIAITKIATTEGEEVFEAEVSEGVQVISPEIAYLATDVMRGVIEGGTASKARLANGQAAAGKTGTTDYGADLWMCGYTPQLSCAVWTGTRDNSPTPLFGGTTSTPIWKKFMDVALKDEKVVKFEEIDTKNIVWRNDWHFKTNDKEEKKKHEEEMKGYKEATEAAKKATEDATKALEEITNGGSENTENTAKNQNSNSNATTPDKQTTNTTH